MNWRMFTRSLWRNGWRNLSNEFVRVYVCVVYECVHLIISFSFIILFIYLFIFTFSFSFFFKCLEMVLFISLFFFNISKICLSHYSRLVSHTYLCPLFLPVFSSDNPFLNHGHPNLHTWKTMIERAWPMAPDMPGWSRNLLSSCLIWERLYKLSDLSFLGFKLKREIIPF